MNMVTFKKILLFLGVNWPKMLVGILFSASLVGFLMFEQIFIFKIIIFVLIGISFWQMYKNKSSEWFFLILLFLSFLSLYNLYFGVSWSFGLIMLGVLAVSGLTYYFFAQDHSDISYLFMILISILELELFLTLVPWPLDPKARSMILVGSFYFFVNVIKLKKDNKINVKNVLGLLMLVVAIMFLLIITSQWYKR